MLAAKFFFHSVGVEKIQHSKALHRVFRRRSVDDSKRANKYPLNFIFGLLEKISWRRGEIQFQLQ